MKVKPYVYRGYGETEMKQQQHLPDCSHRSHDEHNPASDPEQYMMVLQNADRYDRYEELKIDMDCA